MTETLRYAVFDLDGTLLGAGGRLADGAHAAIATVRDRGLLPILATGRSLAGMHSLGGIDGFLALFDDQLLLSNGDVLFDRATGSVRYRRTIPPEAVRRLCAAGLDDVVVEHEGEHVAVSRRAALAFAVAYGLPRRAVRVVPAASAVLPATRITLVGGWPGGDDAGLTGLLAGLGCAAHPGEAFRAAVIHPADTCKAAALTAQLRARFREQGLDRVIAFGDGDNDVRMLTRCRVGVAVSGSRPAAVAAAALQLREPLTDFLRCLDPAGLLRVVPPRRADG